ncbi:hypothetical protein V8E54_009900 [Elaphomyces granulatus]
MFYDGDLQSGIALAVREAKSVICFVRDDEEESTLWEKEYFDDTAKYLEAGAVILRLTANSQETSFLTSFCPISTCPTVVVIKNGMLQAYITPGASKDDFHSRLKTILATNISNSASSASAPSSVATNVDNTPVAASPAAAPPNKPEVSERPDTAEEERKRRESIRAGKRRVDSIEEEEELARERPKTEQEKQIEQQRRLKLQAKEERARVLNQIKQDNEDRKHREELRRLENSANADRGPTAHQPASRPTTSTSEAESYRLQIRLFDGSSVRASFLPSATIRRDLRPWIDRQRTDGKQPYNLKHVLTPHPSHTISVVEEEQTLKDLELGPTSNLVMVPIPSYTDAYAFSNASLPMRALSTGYSIILGIVSAVTATIWSLLGYGFGIPTSNDATSAESSSRQPEDTAGKPQPAASSRNNNIRTLRDQQPDRDDTQFYNGNQLTGGIFSSAMQLNFEPRRENDRGDDQGNT